MVKKKIRKFFNTVCIYEKTPVLFEEHRKKNTVIPWCTAFGIVVAAIAAVYLGALVLTTLLQGRCDRARGCCSALNTLVVSLLGTILLAALLLAVGITATSVISAILVGILIGFVSLALLVSACLVRCLTACGD